MILKLNRHETINGNIVWLNAVLTDAILTLDEIILGNPCPDGCSLCIDNCPVHALGNPAMNQEDCYAHAFHVDEREEFVFKCNTCRTICPNCFGTKNKHMMKRSKKEKN